MAMWRRGGSKGVKYVEQDGRIERGILNLQPPRCAQALSALQAQLLLF